MKKLIAMMLALLMLATLAACGANDTPATTPATDPQETQGEQTPDVTEEVTDPVVAADPYTLNFQGVELVPGAAFDASVLGEAEFVYEVPSCAIEGTDNVYSYGVLEITAFDDGTGEVIYSVYLMDANTPTDEGLYIGDDLATVESIYGTEYTVDGTQLTYQQGDSLLVLLVENDVVISIEYRMAA